MYKKETALKKLEQGQYFGHHLFDNLRDNKEVALAALIWDIDTENITEVDSKFRKDKEFMLEAVKINSAYYRYASDELKDDNEIVLAAIRKHAFHFIDCPKRFKEEKELAMEVIKVNPSCHQYLSNELKDDRDIALEAVKKYPNIYKELTPKNRDDREIFIEAIKPNKIDHIQYASENLKNDKEAILEAIGDSNTYALGKYISDDLKKDRDIAFKAAKNNGASLLHLDDKFFKDTEIIEAAVQSNPNIIKYNESIADDKRLVLMAVQKQGNAVQYASDRLKNDLDVARTALSHGNHNIHHLGEDIKKMCENKDPQQTVERAITYEKLKTQLKPKADEKPTQKLKI